jgi:hypothetical protein
VRRTSLIEMEIDAAGAKRSRNAPWHPRIANRLLRRIRDYGCDRAVVTREWPRKLWAAEVDAISLIHGPTSLPELVRTYRGGPVDSTPGHVGGERPGPRGRLRTVPRTAGFLERTPRGRGQASMRAYDTGHRAYGSGQSGRIFRIGLGARVHLRVENRVRLSDFDYELHFDPHRPRPLRRRPGSWWWIARPGACAPVRDCQLLSQNDCWWWVTRVVPVDFWVGARAGKWVFLTHLRRPSLPGPGASLQALVRRPAS